MARTSTDYMRKRWEVFAREDPLFYVVTRPERRNPETLLAAGAGLVDKVLKWVGDDLPRRRALDLGCGLGRTAVHLARHFEVVDAVDISAGMIERARELSPPGNVRFGVVSGEDLEAFEDGRFDLVVSFLVFQHIPRIGPIATYLREIARVLQPRGKAVLHFDSRPDSLWHRLYKSLPDALLPRVHRRGIRRHRRAPAEIRQLCGEAGLDIREERGSGTSEHFFLLARGRG